MRVVYLNKTVVVFLKTMCSKHIQVLEEKQEQVGSLFNLNEYAVKPNAR